MSIPIYSALYGGYDTIKPLPDGVTGVMYTDHVDLIAPRTGEILPAGWEFRYVPHTFTSEHGDPALVGPMLAHKFWKTHPGEALPGADASIWIDASIEITPEFMAHAEAAIADCDWAMVRHPWRSCIYDEAEYSAFLPRYASLADSIRKQAAWYRSIGHPTKWGLPATGVNVRRHTPAVLEMGACWWDECVNWSHQDQVSLPVLMRLYGETVRCQYTLGWMQHWTLHPHLK